MASAGIGRGGPLLLMLGIVYLQHRDRQQLLGAHPHQQLLAIIPGITAHSSLRCAKKGRNKTRRESIDMVCHHKISVERIFAEAAC